MQQIMLKCGLLFAFVLMVVLLGAGYRLMLELVMVVRLGLHFARIIWDRLISRRL
jgi:hypothetical protein